MAAAASVVSLVDPGTPGAGAAGWPGETDGGAASRGNPDETETGSAAPARLVSAGGGAGTAAEIGAGAGVAGSATAIAAAAATAAAAPSFGGVFTFASPGSAGAAVSPAARSTAPPPRAATSRSASGMASELPLSGERPIEPANFAFAPTQAIGIPGVPSPVAGSAADCGPGGVAAPRAVAKLSAPSPASAARLPALARSDGSAPPLA